MALYAFHVLSVGWPYAVHLLSFRCFYAVSFLLIMNQHAITNQYFALILGRKDACFNLEAMTDVILIFEQFF